jgi:hypothetical protein
MPVSALSNPPTDIEKAYNNSKNLQLQTFSQVEPPGEDEESLEDLSVEYEQVDNEPAQVIQKMKVRASERKLPCVVDAPLYFAVYTGNFP